MATPRKSTRSAKKAPAKRSMAKPPADAAVRLLSGGNPQIAKGDGDGPVQAYIAAMPEWKRDVGRWVDALVVARVPGVRKAVKWNSPMYGGPEGGFFVAMHVFAKFVRLTFFRGTSLRPMPPGTSKVEGTRYLDIREHDPRDDTQLGRWIEQAAAQPGWVP